LGEFFKIAFDYIPSTDTSNAASAFFPPIDAVIKMARPLTEGETMLPSHEGRAYIRRMISEAAERSKEP
jgi:hypothetical protein